MIQFPVVRRLAIKNYELFKNSKSDSIEHKFDRGVHAVVGINGLGKTTVLNIIYRALLGPFDQSKSDDAGLLGSQHELSAWRTRGFFRDRVPDKARDATVEVDISFGSRLLTVRRRLSNLNIEYLRVDDTELGSDQDVFERSVVELSGAATYFDYFAILRYLVFFLEDRVELIWDRRSQFDMLRILLFDTNAAKTASTAYDEAQSADSQHRNRRAILGKDRDRLKLLEESSGETLAAEFRALQSAIAHAEELDRGQAQKIEEAQDRIDGATLQREKALLDLQEARTALEFEEQAHYQHLFPTLDATAKYVFQNLLSGGGCLVCGSVSDDAAAYLRGKLEEHVCPICHSTPDKQEKITPTADFSLAKLKKNKAKVEQLRTAAKVASTEISNADADYEQLVNRREEDRQKLRTLRNQLRELGFTELPSESDIEDLRAIVAEGEREVARLQAARSAAEAKYGRIFRKQRGRIDQTVSLIRKNFREFAQIVLAERCELNVSSDKRSIGQEGAKFDFPYFEVMMTSGVFNQSLSTREGKEAVSESQREFLDIAFRLSLISAATAGRADAMLVLETPESSLDSLFVSLAGEAFRGNLVKMRSKIWPFLSRDAVLIGLIVA